MQPRRLGHLHTVLAGKREFSEPIADAAVAASEEVSAPEFRFQGALSKIQAHSG